MVQTYNVHNNVERSLYFEKPSELYQIKHCCSNIFLIHCICFGEPLGAAVFELLLNRPDDYLPPACSSTHAHDKAQGPRLSGMEALAQEVRRCMAQIAFLTFLAKSSVILTVKGSSFFCKTNHPTIPPFFSYLLPPRPYGNFKKSYFLSTLGNSWRKARTNNKLNAHIYNSVTSGIRVQASLMGGDSCSPFLRSKSVIHAFSRL